MSVHSIHSSSVIRLSPSTSQYRRKFRRHFLLNLSSVCNARISALNDLTSRRSNICSNHSNNNGNIRQQQLQQRRLGPTAFDFYFTGHFLLLQVRLSLLRDYFWCAKFTFFVIGCMQKPPMTAVWLRLPDEAVRVAVAHRLGCKACELHKSMCGKAVNGRSLHGLSILMPRQRHSRLNDICWTAGEQAQMPAVKELVSRMLDDNKRPDRTIFALGNRKANCLGCDSTGHLCRIPHCHHGDHTRCGSTHSSTEEERQVPYARLSNTRLLSICRRNS